MAAKNKEVIEVKGIILESLPNAMFLVELEHNHHRLLADPFLGATLLSVYVQGREPNDIRLGVDLGSRLRRRFDLLIRLTRFTAVTAARGEQRKYQDHSEHWSNSCHNGESFKPAHFFDYRLSWVNSVNSLAQNSPPMSTATWSHPFQNGLGSWLCRTCVPLRRSGTATTALLIDTHGPRPACRHPASRRNRLGMI